jgi:hypothetical protein
MLAVSMQSNCQVSMNVEIVTVGGATLLNWHINFAAGKIRPDRMHLMALMRTMGVHMLSRCRASMWHFGRVAFQRVARLALLTSPDQRDRTAVGAISLYSEL